LQRELTLAKHKAELVRVELIMLQKRYRKLQEASSKSYKPMFSFAGLRLRVELNFFDDDEQRAMKLPWSRLGMALWRK
jgi:hypothetical protein